MGLTEFVDPPSTLTIVMAFRKELRVRISLRRVREPLRCRSKFGLNYFGLRSNSRSRLIYLAALKHSCIFSEAVLQYRKVP